MRSAMTDDAEHDDWKMLVARSHAVQYAICLACGWRGPERTGTEERALVWEDMDAHLAEADNIHQERLALSLPNAMPPRKDGLPE